MYLVLVEREQSTIRLKNIHSRAIELYKSHGMDMIQLIAEACPSLFNDWSSKDTIILHAIANDLMDLVLHFTSVIVDFGMNWRDEYGNNILHVAGRKAHAYLATICEPLRYEHNDSHQTPVMYQHREQSPLYERSLSNQFDFEETQLLVRQPQAQIYEYRPESPEQACCCGVM